MGEGSESSFLEKLFRWKKEKNTPPSKEQLLAEATKNAREAVTLFVRAPTQSSIAEFYPGKENTFDMDKQNKPPGTILRIAVDRQISNAQTESGYWWCAIGITDQGEKYLFDIWADPGNGGHSFSDPELRVYSEFKLSNAEAKSPSFKVEEIFNNASPFIGQELTTIKRIDVMMGGVSQKNTKRITTTDVGSGADIIPGSIPVPNS